MARPDLVKKRERKRAPRTTGTTVRKPKARSWWRSIWCRFGVEVGGLSYVVQVLFARSLCLTCFVQGKDLYKMTAPIDCRDEC